MSKRIVAILFVAHLVVALGASSAQEKPATHDRDALKTRVAAFALSNETIFDGFAKLNQITPLAFAVEYILKPTIKDPPIPIPSFTAEITDTTIKGVLDWLCALDSRYTWQRHGNVINVFPRSKEADPNYLMNRTLHQSNLRKAAAADTAVLQAILQLPPPREQIANLQSGGDWGFAKPWSEQLENVNIRDVADLAAQRLGRSYGWQLTGAQNFRVIIFHARLMPSPKQLPQSKQ